MTDSKHIEYPNLFHLSRRMDILWLEPRVPPSVMEGEDDVMPRICWASSVDGALASMCGGAAGACYAVYVPDGPVDPSEIVVPTKEDVPDGPACGEIWTVGSVIHVRLVGFIKCHDVLSYALTSVETSKGTFPVGKYVYDWEWLWKDENFGKVRG